MPLTAFHWMLRLHKWQPKPTERSGGHIHWIHPSCRRPAPLTCEQAAAEWQFSWASTYRSLAVCFRLQRNHKWYTINSCHQQHSGSHGWQHHQALLQWRHLPDHHGGAGGHVQAHPYWNLTGDQQVTQTRGGGLEVYTAIIDSKWIVKKKKKSLVRRIRKAMRRCFDWFEVICTTRNVVAQDAFGAATSCYASRSVSQMFVVSFF